MLLSSRYFCFQIFEDLYLFYQIKGFVGTLCENKYTTNSNVCEFNPCKRGACIALGAE